MHLSLKTKAEKNLQIFPIIRAETSDHNYSKTSLSPEHKAQ